MPPAITTSASPSSPTSLRIRKGDTVKLENPKLSNLLLGKAYTESVPVPDGIVDGMDGAVVVFNRVTGRELNRLRELHSEMDAYDYGLVMLDRYCASITHDGETLELSEEVLLQLPPALLDWLDGTASGMIRASATIMGEASDARLKTT